MTTMDPSQPVTREAGPPEAVAGASLAEARTARPIWPLAVVLVVGVLARLLLQLRGFNYDFESYVIVSELMAEGKNVYANTERYNYGPVWFYLLHLLRSISGGQVTDFRIALVIFLTLVDVGIFAVLLRMVGRLAAILFFLNPISVIITGYHNQFDNLALLLGMVATLLIADRFDKPVDGRKATGLLLLGLSLATKHLLFVFPLWLAVKQRGWLQRAIVLVVPLAIFALSFAPFWGEGREGILQNVVRYQSWDTDMFYRHWVPNLVQMFVSARDVWLILLTLAAFLLMRIKSFPSLLLYTALLVGAAPAITNQYLAIPAAFVSAYFNPFAVIYTLTGTWFLFFDVYGLHVPQPAWHPDISRLGFYTVMTTMLLASFVLVVWRSAIVDLLHRFWREARTWLKG